MCAAMDVNDALKTMRIQAFHDGDQALVDIGLRWPESVHSRAWLRVCPGGGPERAALQCVDIEKVDDQDVGQGRADGREETGAWGDELGLRQMRAGGMQTVVRPAVVIGHAAIGQESVSFWS